MYNIVNNDVIMYSDVTIFFFFFFFFFFFSIVIDEDHLINLMIEDVTREFTDD